MSFPFLPITFLHHFTMAVKQHRLMWAPGNHSLKGAALPLPTEHSLADQGAPAPATEPLLSSIRGHTCLPLKERDQVLLSWCRPQNPCQQGCCRHSLWLSHFAGGRVTGNPWHKEDPDHMDAALAVFFFFLMQTGDHPRDSQVAQW